MQNLFKDLESLLQQDQAFISDGAILKNVVIEATLNMDAGLLALLVQSPTIKAHFFTEVAGALVFDKVKFQNFVSNKAFLPDSYTAFKNRIGLTDGRGDYLSQSRDVVLAWPYKDCVLEGGMTKEDQGRNEVFWNTTLAPDDITRLFEPKVLTGWERWDGEAVAAGKAKPVGDVTEEDNLLIKGNNLLALYSLKARYAGKVKLIYIDPPYNTGSDGFRYNDRFNHSAWLTFMRNRLEVAKELLSLDGTIFVTLDDGEAHYAKVLLDEVFGRDCFVSNVVWRSSDNSNNDAKRFSTDHNHILVFSRTEGWLSNKLSATKDQSKHFKNPDNDPRGPWFDGNPLGSPGYRANLVYDIIGPNDDVISPPKNGWRWSKETLKQKMTTGEIRFTENGKGIRRRTYLNEQKGLPPSSLWTDLESTGHNRQAHFEVLKLLAEDGDEDYQVTPKPEKLIQRILQVATAEGDLVLDFFAGTGTTAATAAKMKRRWLGIEQMDYIQDFPMSRLKKVIQGEQGGISKAVEWQGGGSFVYAELAQSNATFVDRIDAAQDIATLQTIHADTQATGYLHYDVDMSTFDTEGFAALSLDDAKSVLMDCLDANHLYVNLGSLGDTDFNISDEDAAATRSFYGVSE